MTLDPKVERRLQTEQNLWLATVRPDGSPHLVPIALEDGNQPIVVEGRAQSIGRADTAVLAEFQRKYDWDITTDDAYTQVIEIQPKKIRA